MIFMLDLLYDFFEFSLLSLYIVPSPVTNLSIAINGSNSSSLTISWDPPIRPNGNLDYNISLSFTDLATNVTQMVLQAQYPEGTRVVEYNSVEPYAEYQVEVIALTEVGSSSPEVAMVTTSQGSESSQHKDF